jgi:hypothetical protein
MRLLFSTIGLFLLASAVAFAADGRFGQTTLAVEGGSQAQTVFAPDTPKIVLHAEILEMPIGTKLTATWIAVKTDVAPANYKIESADLEVKQAVASDETSFWVTKPDAGWPVGDYKVDLSINGQVATSVSFKVAR